MDFFRDAIQILLLIAICGLMYFLKDLPTFFREFRLEKTRAQNSMELQRESFFRDISNGQIASIFDEWLSFFTDSRKKVNSDSKFAKQLKELLHKTILYGSTNTVKICAEMQAYIYQEKNEDDNGFTLFVFMTKLICSLKYDFTGYEIEVDDLLQMKLKDFHTKENQEKFKKAKNYVEKALK